MLRFDWFLNYAALRVSSKILLVIVLGEAAIMALLHLLPLQFTPLQEAIVDTLLLGVISAVVIHIWVVRPIKLAKEQNQLFDSLVSNLDAGMVVTDPACDNAIIYVNPAFERITGYGAGEVAGKHPRLLQGDDVDVEALEQTRRAMSAGEAVRVVLKNRRKDGTPFWNDLHLNPIVGGDGTVRYWVGLIHDITERREIELQNARWASALEQSGEAVCVFDEHGVIQFVNASFCRNAKAEEAELVGQSVFRFWHADDNFDALCGSVKQQHGWSGRHRRLRMDGSEYEALSTVNPISDGDTLLFVSVHRDISGMAAMEEQLRQSQKMEAVGMLVSGIAHDFNNVLAGILGNLYLIKRRFRDDEKLFKRVEGVEEQGYAAAGMIRQLLSFSRKNPAENRAVDLVPFVKEVVKFSSATVPESIECDLRLPDTSASVLCDPVQMQQVLLNLIVNATHAIQAREQGHGRITLSCSTGGAPSSVDAAHATDSWVQLSVVDDGIGIEAEQLSRIFEPFYTTKESGVGTGLGLAMVQSYIHSLGGVITVNSQPDKGSCFDIYLPMCESEDSGTHKVSEEVIDGKGRFVLLADDDPGVRGALCDILEAANYRVIEAANGEEAMEKFREFADQLHLAMLDIVMPKASGAEVAEHIRNRRDDLPVIFMTGYANRELELIKADAESLLAKPWDIENLNAALKKSLSA